MATEIEAPMRAKGMVHKLISDTAKGCCEEAYTSLAQNNRFYKMWPDRAKFVRIKWPLYIHVARQILIHMLGSPSVSDDQKELIADAILRDGAINPKKMATPEKRRFFTGPTG